ncbi:hypothetical protein ACFST9_22000 [Hymenobacter monticola]|uniref:Abi family protein n=1 Tax=Hymenobacter monticola TaxID=1705399 RepID=A0ABY4B5S5_9BACT|nr:hypothetical protein [Hymenobacter monticola]UOE34224.1 hypothetical protein MTP16_00905 [Hymenobacter monticola]
MFSDYENLFSVERMSRYLTAANGQQESAVQLYHANLKLSEALYSPLAMLEVALRNQLNHALQAHFQQPNWLITQQAGFMRDPGFRFRNPRTGQLVTNDFLLRSVQTAEKKLRGRVTQSALLSELMFGFWTELFDPTPFRILQGKPLTVFGQKPPSIKRVDIFTKLTEVRKLRNRVYHYEPICLRQQLACLTDLRIIHGYVRELSSWLDANLPAIMNPLDRFDSVCQVVCQELHFVQP